MSFENKITIIGNLTRDPELRYTTGGTAVANFSVAYTPRRRNANGEWEDGDTSFFNCTAWRDLGEHIAGSFQKGQRVIVLGTMNQRFWEDDDGKKRNTYEIDVDDAGHSVKWGTSSFDKTERSSGRSNGGGGRPPAREPDPIYGDEEPF